MFVVNVLHAIFKYFTSTPQEIITKKTKIPPQLRNQVWTTYHREKDHGICYVCGTQIYRYNRGWHCSHVHADVKGGSTTLDNLRTCCQYCNLSMGNQNLYAYIRDNRLRGPGSKNVRSYFQQYPDQQYDKRTNNWGRKTSSSQQISNNNWDLIPMTNNNSKRRPIISHMNSVQNTSSGPTVFDQLLGWLKNDQ